MPASDLPAAILRALRERDAQSPAMLRKRLDLPMGLLLRTLPALEAAGLLERSLHGRRELIRLTAAGKALLASLPENSDKP